MNINIIKLLNFRNIHKAIRRATRGRFKYKYGAIKFIDKLPYSITIIRESIFKYLYYSKPYVLFSIKDTKTRYIHAPAFTDKLLQYCLSNLLDNKIAKRFIYDSYACVKGKGPQRAILRMCQFQTNAYNNYKNPMLVKLDISKFFYSINRSVLFNILCKYITCKDTRILIIEKLKFFLSRKGLPLGNLTSQLFANILLNEFDQYVKHRLKIKFYLRYADDMFIIVDGKKEAYKVMELCRSFLKDVLDLDCNPKKCYIRKADKIVCLGFNIVRNKKTGKQYLYVLSRTKNKLYKILNSKYILDKSLGGYLNRIWNSKNRSMSRLATTDDIVARLNSWYGHVKIAKIHSYIYRTLCKCERRDIWFDGSKFYKVST